MKSKKFVKLLTTLVTEIVRNELYKILSENEINLISEKKKETVSVYDKEFTEFLTVARDKYGACMI